MNMYYVYSLFVYSAINYVYSHSQRRCNHKWSLCIRFLLDGYCVWLKEVVACIDLEFLFQEQGDL
jgi:hypothetical protein